MRELKKKLGEDYDSDEHPLPSPSSKPGKRKKYVSLSFFFRSRVKQSRRKHQQAAVKSKSIAIQCSGESNVTVPSKIPLKISASWPGASLGDSKQVDVTIPQTSSFQKRAAEFHSKLGYKSQPVMRSAIAVHQFWKVTKSPSTRHILPHVVKKHKALRSALKCVMEEVGKDDLEVKRSLQKDIRCCIRLREKKKFRDICRIRSTWKEKGLSVRSVSRLTNTPMSTLMSYLREIKVHARRIQPHQAAEVLEFFSRNDVTLQLPSKRHAGKYFLRTPFQEQYDRYCEMQTSKGRVVLSKSSVLRLLPKKQFKVCGKIPFQNCKCIRCENTKLAIAAVLKAGVTSVSRSVTANCVMSCCSPGPEDIRRKGIYICPRKCMLRECSGCRHRYSSILNSNNKKLLLRKNCKWHQWAQDYKWVNGERVKDVYRRQLFRGTVADLLGVLKLAMIALPMHVFLSKWQAKCMEDCRNSLKPGEVLMVLDFAKNITLSRQREVQYAFFSRLSVTFHSIVMYYWCPHKGFCNHQITDEFMCLTPDLTHDSHAVHEFTKLALQHLRDQGVPVNKLYQFSDNQCAQYKSHVSFELMFELEAMFDIIIEKHYTGAGHGKGPADGAVGRIKALLARAVLGGEICIQNSHELYLFLTKKFAKIMEDEDMCMHYRRSFAYVPEVDRSVELVSSTLNGSMKLHSIKTAGRGCLLVRDTSCFCR